MVNGVIQIVAAVLFVVVHLSTDMGIIWLWIAGVYFAVGIGNLAVYAIRSKHQLRTAQKQAEKTAKEAEKTIKEAEKTAKEAERTALLAKQTVSIPDADASSESVPK